MRLLSWNVNGIRAVTKKGFLSWLEAEKPDVLCLQETKAHPGQLQPELVQPDGYRAIYAAAKRKGYSGVSTWVRKGRGKKIPKLIAEPLTGIGIERFDDEGRIVITEFAEFVLLNCYFPNSQRELGRLDYKLEFYDAILAYSNQLRRRGKGVIICGDYNTAHTEDDLARPKGNVNNSGFLPIERSYVDRFVAAGYVDTFRLFHQGAGHYTWWSYMFNARASNVGWRIDYFFVSDDLTERVTAASILPDVTGSDHCPVVVDIST